MRRRSIVLTVLLPIAAWIVFEVVYALTGEAAPHVDYMNRLTDLVAKYQPEGANGWTTLAEAGERAERIQTSWVRRWEDQADEPGYRPDYSLLLATGPVDEASLEWELDAIEEMRAEGVMDLMAEGAAAPRLLRVLPADVDAFSVQLPNLARFRALARMRVATMRLALHRGDLPEAVAAFDQSLALVRAAGSQAFIIDRLVANAIAHLALAELQHGLVEHELDAATCRGFLEAIDRQLPLPPVEIMFEGERLAVLDIIQDTFTDDGHGDGRMNPLKAIELNRMAMGGTGPAGLVQIAGRKETVRLLDARTEGMIALARQSPAARLNAPAFDEAAFNAQLSIRHQMVQMFIGPGVRYLEIDDELRFTVAATRIMIALQAYHAIHGTYPTTLSDLVPEILDAVPADPVGGAPFAYRFPSDEPSLPYVLTSSGLDGVDDSAGAGPDAPRAGIGDDVLLAPRRPADPD